MACSNRPISSSSSAFKVLKVALCVDLDGAVSGGLALLFGRLALFEPIANARQAIPTGSVDTILLGGSRIRAGADPTRQHDPIRTNRHQKSRRKSFCSAGVLAKTVRKLSRKSSGSDRSIAAKARSASCSSPKATPATLGAQQAAEADHIRAQRAVQCDIVDLVVHRSGASLARTPNPSKNSASDCFT